MSAPTKVSAKVRGMGRRSDIEAVLDEYNVVYTYEYAVSTHDFDIERSLHNQARFKPLDDEVVERYFDAVVRGDRFPAVVAYRHGRRAAGKLIMVDGNHRHRAHDKANSPIDVYELDPSTEPQVIALLTHLFNTRHGLPSSDEERVQAAVYMVDSGSSAIEAAAMLNVPLAKVRDAVNRKKLQARAKRARIDMIKWDRLSGGAQAKLGQIKSAGLFRDTAHLVAESDLPLPEVTSLVKMINSTDDHDQQEVIVGSERDRLRQRIQQAGGGHLRANNRRGLETTPKQQVVMSLGALLKVVRGHDHDEVANAFQPAERIDKASEIRSIIDWLSDLATDLAPDVT